MKALLLLSALLSGAAMAVEKDVPYLPSAGAEQRLDLYFPKKALRPPLLVFVHGGAWIGGDKSDYQKVGETFSALGSAVAVVNYRLSTVPEVRHPMHAEDVAQAIAFLTSEDRKYAYDPERIYVAGHSAGAHIAGVLAADRKYFTDLDVPRRRRPKGYVGLSGIYDLPKLQATFPGYKDWFLSKAFGTDLSTWAAASPALTKFRDEMPWVLIHSKADELVNIGQSEGFADHLRHQDIHVGMVALEKADHFATVRQLFEKRSDATQAINTFLWAPAELAKEPVKSAKAVK